MVNVADIPQKWIRKYESCIIEILSKQKHGFYMRSEEPLPRYTSIPVESPALGMDTSARNTV